MVELSEQGITQVATQAGDALSGLVWTVLAIVCVGVVIGLVFYILSFKHKVKLKILGNNGVKYPFDDSAREVKVDGVLYWKLRKRKDLIAIPPRESLYPLGKSFMGGVRYYAEGYYDHELGYVWANDRVSSEAFERGMITEHDGKRYVVDPLVPFTTQQRALYIAQLEKAFARRKRGLLDTISQFATPIMFVVLILAILVFWEDIAKPSREIAAQAATISEQNAQISEQNARMLSILAGKLDKGELVVSQTIPPPDAVVS